MSQKLQKLAQLPSLPTVAIRLLKMISDSEAGIADVVFVLQTDPAISGKILRAANSSQMGLKKPVSDLQRAVMLLGKKPVMALALGFSLAEASMRNGPHASRFMDTWFQALVRGCAASVLARKFSRVEAGEGFTMGLLARIGRLALLNSNPGPFLACVEEAEKTNSAVAEVEARNLEVTSQHITEFLMAEWKLPTHCVEAVKNLSVPFEQFCANRDASRITLSDVLVIATAFGEFFSGENRGLAIAKIYELCNVILNLQDQDVNALVDQVRQELDAHSHLFSVDMTKVGTPMELMSQAMSQLAEIATAAAMPPDLQQPLPTEIMEENGRLRRRVIELTQSSMTDGLTGLFNRSYLMQHLEERCVRSVENQAPVAVLLIDIDHFKKVNDVHGHLVGDEVLMLIAKALKETVRENDVVTRYGGEEFVVLSSAPDRFGLERQAERIRERIASKTLVSGDVQLKVTASLGGAIATPAPHQTSFAKDLLETADNALYRSKRAGRNRVTVIDALMPQADPSSGTALLTCGS